MCLLNQILEAQKIGLLIPLRVNVGHFKPKAVKNTNDNDDDDNDTNDDDDGDDSPESYAPAYAITTPCFAVRQCSHCHHQSLVMMTMMVVTMIIMMTWQ